MQIKKYKYRYKSRNTNTYTNQEIQIQIKKYKYISRNTNTNPGGWFCRVSKNVFRGSEVSKSRLPAFPEFAKICQQKYKKQTNSIKARK